MERKRADNNSGNLVYIQLFLMIVCVGSSPCSPEEDRLGRYTIRGGSGSIWSVGIPSGSTVQVSISCDAGAIAQQSVTSQCVNGIWTTAWPRCEKPCSVPRNNHEVRQFVNGDPTMPINRFYSTPTLPDGTFLIARCKDPGKRRLVGDQRRTCKGGQWQGEAPECHTVQTKVLFRGADREVAANGTVVVYVHQGDERYLDVVCKIPRPYLTTSPRMTTPLENDRDLEHWHGWRHHKKRLRPISTDFSGMYTCTWSPLSHSVHVLFKAAECEVPTAPEHGRLRVAAGLHPGDLASAGTTVSFECEDDYRLVGSSRAFCAKGDWSNDPPVCKATKCPELTIPDYAVMEGVYGYGRNIGDERIFYCLQGYVLRGVTNNLLCMENGMWSHPLPTCEAASIHPVSPCENLRCASWQRCEVARNNTAFCGCISPSSCLTSGPTVCGTNGEYYTSECHLKAHACIYNLPIDITENENICIEGIPVEDHTQIPAPVDYHYPSGSSSFLSSFEVDGVQSNPTDPPVDPNPPPQESALESDAFGYNSFISLDSDNEPSFVSLFDESIERTDDSLPKTTSESQLGVTPSTSAQTQPRIPHGSYQTTQLSNQSQPGITDELHQTTKPSNQSQPGITDELHQTTKPSNQSQPGITDETRLTPPPPPSNQSQPEFAVESHEITQPSNQSQANEEMDQTTQASGSTQNQPGDDDETTKSTHNNSTLSNQVTLSALNSE